MVVGRSSSFIEGFKSFTADDDLMLANLKQALEYSKEDLAIPDAKSKLNLPSSKNTNTNTNSNMPSTTMPSSAMPSSTMAAMATIPATTKPISTPAITKSGMNMNMNKNMNTMPTKPETTMPETFKNVMGNKKVNKKGEEKFRDVKMVRNIVEDDMEDDEDGMEDENSNADLDEDEMDEGEKMIEGFQGSIKLESRFARNILLALLLTAIGYLIVHSSMNNLIPLAEISPQLKKFKNMIYGGLFFLIAYICLEVF